ncbi:TolC family protein [Xylophilus sp.]|uniref:TolC family protein n=1 Tax=Xylophilus sp. TaxID=2653893 RepID=UPI0013B7820E|nr:TolC family protein [Xylophilus sp.]KAF1050140.1 MAG: Cobalt-zinc-cadmium resistance protein CzcC [Xylophilus sp.]
MSIRQLFLSAGAGLGLGLTLALTPPSGWAQTAPAAPAPATPIPAALTLGQALAAARGNSDVIIARRAAEAARADVRAANHAPLPTLTAQAESIDLQNGVGAGNALTRKRVDKSLGIDWTWERGNKRALRTLAATRNAEAAEADVEDMRLQQLQATLAAYVDLLAAQEREQEVAAIAEGNNQLARSATRRVQAGDLAVQEAARTAIEAQRAAGDVQSAVLDRQRAALALAQFTGGSVPARADADAWQRLLAAQGGGASDLDIVSFVESTPEVRAALARVQAGQAALDNAQALKKTDLTIGTSVHHYPGTSNRMVDVRVSMPLQWGYGYEGEIGRAQAEYAQAQEALDKARRVATLDLQRLRQEADTAAARAARYDTGILPQARQVAQSAELAFQRGASSLTDLLDARRTLRATLLEALDARADQAKAAGAWLLRTRPQALTDTNAQ